MKRIPLRILGVVKDSIRIYKDIFKFTLSSLSSFVLDYILFTVFVLMLSRGAGMVIAANVAARIISAFFNYSMNCRFVFHTHRQVRTAADYFILAGIILALNNVVLEIFMYSFHIHAQMAKLMTECVLFVFSWLFQNKVIFRKRKEADL